MSTCEQCGYEYTTIQCLCKLDSINVKGYNLATLDDFDKNIVKVILQDIEKSKIKCFLLHGPSGSGKTHMAIALARYYASIMIDNITRFRFGFMSSLKLSRLPSKREEQIEDFLKCDILIIDEFSNDLFDVIYSRIFEDEKITICTTNANIETLDKRLSWRLKSFEMSDKFLDIDGAYQSKLSLYNKFEKYKNENFDNEIDLSDFYDGLDTCGVTGMQSGTNQYYNNFKL